MKKIRIIAEIGCNHNGDLCLAKRLVDEACICGVDAIKFQTFKAEELISINAPKAEYQIETTGSDESQLEMTKKLELSYSDYLILKQYVEDKNMQVFSTAFDLDSINFLDSIGQKIWKIPSGEITNVPYLEAIRDLNIDGKNIILSTGMATLDEIKFAVEILDDKFEKLTILHCNTEYPTPDVDVNISALEELKKNFSEYDLGFSDHSIGSIAAILSVNYGVSLIEKHFTLNKELPGPDHKASATPEELILLVESVHRAEKMLGSQRKIVTVSESKNKVIARKSIVAKVKIRKGDKLTASNITCKRPGSGISPVFWHEVLNTCAEKDFEEDELLTSSVVSLL